MKRFLMFFSSLVFCFTSSAFAQTASPSSAPVVLMKTNLGNIKIQLLTQKAPKTVANFLHYVQSKHYDGTIFHRVINGFMIQGGAYTPQFEKKSTQAPITLENKNGLKNEIGTIAMARTSDPNSATDQFFINTADNTGLNYPNPDGYGYAVFGKIISGMKVVNKIQHVNTGVQHGMSDLPTQAVIIESARLIKN